MKKQLSTKEFSDLIGKSTRNVTHSLSMLDILKSARPTSEAGSKAQLRRIETRLKWLTPAYVKHEKKGGNYLITVRV